MPVNSKTSACRNEGAERTYLASTNGAQSTYQKKGRIGSEKTGLSIYAFAFGVANFPTHVCECFAATQRNDLRRETELGTTPERSGSKKGTCTHMFTHKPCTHAVSLSQLKRLEAAERTVLKRLRNESIVQHEAQRAQVPLATHLYAILYIADLACVRRP